MSSHNLALIFAPNLLKAGHASDRHRSDALQDRPNRAELKANRSDSSSNTATVDESGEPSMVLWRCCAAPVTWPRYRPRTRRPR